VEFHSDKL